VLLLPDAIDAYGVMTKLVGPAATYVLSLDSVEMMWLGLGSVSSSLGQMLRRRRGRPRKFATPSRAITLTLPESVLEELAKVASDPSLAIVQLVKKRLPLNGKAAAELVPFGQRAVISVKASSTLQQRAGIELVPLPDGRALISFDQPTTIPDLELAIYDALEEGSMSREDREVFEAIGRILREARRADDVSLLRRSIIVLETTGTTRPRKARGRKTA
jgi:hypothetical protein